MNNVFLNKMKWTGTESAWLILQLHKRQFNWSAFADVKQAYLQ